ncbi:MAG: DNA replication/repair protein RecF [Ruminococcaceae bacterium]|nr:DNA replication/repair protein RecF [Oscillospiraceae bacterium]
MRLDSVRIENFRNYSDVYCAFDPGVNLILGENAQGKTNLLEAIHYLAMGKAFRTRKEAELIRFGAEFAQLEGLITGQERQHTLKTVLFSGRKSRQLYLNGVKKKTHAEVNGILTTILFCPEDLMILKSGSSVRRRFLDHGLGILRPRYDTALAEYTRILESKSKILRDRFQEPSLLQILPDYSRRLCQVGAILISYRARYLQALGEEATRFHQAFSGGRETLEIPYRTVSTITDPFAPVQVLEDQLLAHLASHERAELESAQCLTGPHKDDFDAALDGLSLKSFGSQGQTRTAAISLKLAQRELAQRELGEEPVLLLDDVLSELDPGRQDFVLNQIRSGQVFITCCEPERLTRLGKRIRIHGGTISEE